METVKVLVVVSGGVAEAYAGPFVEVEIVDLDNIKECDEEYTISPAFRELAKQAGVENEVTFA